MANRPAGRLAARAPRFRVVREERDVLTDRPAAVAPANRMIHPSD